MIISQRQLMISCLSKCTPSRSDASFHRRQSEPVWVGLDGKRRRIETGSAKSVSQKSPVTLHSFRFKTSGLSASCPFLSSSMRASRFLTSLVLRNSLVQQPPAAWSRRRNPRVSTFFVSSSFPRNNFKQISTSSRCYSQSSNTSNPAAVHLIKEQVYTDDLCHPSISTSTTSGVGSKMGVEEDKALKHYILPLDQPVVSLDCSEAFNGLNPEEKLYAHHLAQASWVGGLVVLVQTSPESPVIFSLLHDLFSSNGVEGLKTVAIGDCNFTQDEWKALLVYTCGVFASMGNYKGFGDTKFIPGVPCDKLGSLLGIAKFGMGAEDVKAKWEYVKDKMYSLGDRERQLGLGEKGVTTYFSANCTTKDAELIQQFLKEEKLEAWNTRCFKTVEGTSVTYEIRSASADLVQEKPVSKEFEGARVNLTIGDYSPLMAELASHLEKAQKHASNDTEKSMLKSYEASFLQGSVDKHKDGSRFWIKDKGPVIETYIGFIETYRDPTGVRAEFEGFVAVVNRETSKKFGKLVDHATDFLKLLPWPKEFERETFMKPDFTSLDVLTFAGSGIPAGINIPNYDEIRQNEGFKNVSLGNVIPASYKDSVIPFLSSEDKAMLEKYRVPSFSVQVALHELLGHGSGKLLKKNEDGTTNYSADLINPLTGQLIEQCYDHNDTYDSIFGSMGSAFEECRAECVGILLSLDKTILKEVFGYEGTEAEDVIYVNWLSMIYAGAAKALEMYQPSADGQGQWMQAHSQARFSILRVLIEAGEGLVDVQQIVGADGKPDLLISLDRNKIYTVGRAAINDYLLKIQVFKATADVVSARTMFDRLTAVDNDGKYPWAAWREIVMDKKQPRKFFVQHNTFLEGKTVGLKNYDATPEGLVQSWIERFPKGSSNIYRDLDYNWLKDRKHF